MSQNNQPPSRNLVYLSDTSGTGYWRHIQQINAVNCIANNVNIGNTYTQFPILDQNYYKGITSVTVQRWINDQQFQIFEQFLKPICQANGAWLVYAIDDAMHYEEIPLYNRGRQAFASEKIQANIKTMLNDSDLVIVTTDRIKQYYHERYGIPLENILAVPNMIPHSWFGDKYDVEKSVEDFKRFKAKPRIAVVSSLSHYNVDGVRMTKDGKSVRKTDDPITKETIWKDQDGNIVQYNETEEITDDLDEIIETIESTIDDFQWVFFGFNPPKLKKYFDAKKIEYHGGTAILNYPSVLKQLRAQAIIAPIKKMTFNYCKSPIKFIECAAIGVPLFAQNCPPYSDYMPDKNMLFDSAEDLKEKLMKLKFQTSVGAYRNQIESNFKWINSPHHDGDFDLKNYWLEENLGIWINIFKLRNKGLDIPLSVFKSQYEAKQKQEAESIIYKENGVEIVK